MFDLLSLLCRFVFEFHLDGCRKYRELTRFGPQTKESKSALTEKDEEIESLRRQLTLSRDMSKVSSASTSADSNSQVASPMATNSQLLGCADANRALPTHNLQLGFCRC